MMMEHGEAQRPVNVEELYSTHRRSTGCMRLGTGDRPVDRRAQSRAAAGHHTLSPSPFFSAFIIIEFFRRGFSTLCGPLHRHWQHSSPRNRTASPRSGARNRLHHHRHRRHPHPPPDRSTPPLPVASCVRCLLLLLPPLAPHRAWPPPRHPSVTYHAQGRCCPRRP